MAWAECVAFPFSRSNFSISRRSTAAALEEMLRINLIIFAPPGLIAPNGELAVPRLSLSRTRRLSLLRNGCKRFDLKVPTSRRMMALVRSFLLSAAVGQLLYLAKFGGYHLLTADAPGTPLIERSITITNNYWRDFMNYLNYHLLLLRLGVV